MACYGGTPFRAPACAEGAHHIGRRWYLCSFCKRFAWRQRRNSRGDSHTTQAIGFIGLRPQLGHARWRICGTVRLRVSSRIGRHVRESLRWNWPLALVLWIYAAIQLIVSGWPFDFVRLCVWGLANRVFVLWPTLAVLRLWHSGVASLTLWLVRPLCGNGEWGRRPNTRSTSRATARIAGGWKWRWCDSVADFAIGAGAAIRLEGPVSSYSFRRFHPFTQSFALWLTSKIHRFRRKSGWQLRSAFYCSSFSALCILRPVPGFRK